MVADAQSDGHRGVLQDHRTNRQTNDPENVPNVVQTGEIESKGFELEGAFVFGNDVTLTASYSHREAEVTRGNIEWEVGRRLIDTPQDLASVWIAKGFQTGNDMTLRAGLGGRYVGSTVSAGPTTSIRTPGNTLADALLELQMPSWTFALNVRVHAWRLAVDRTAVPPGADRRGNRRADRAPATARLHDDAAAFAAAPSRRLRCPPIEGALGAARPDDDPRAGERPVSLVQARQHGDAHRRDRAQASPTTRKPPDEPRAERITKPVHRTGVDWGCELHWTGERADRRRGSTRSRGWCSRC